MATRLDTNFSVFRKHVALGPALDHGSFASVYPLVPRLGVDSRLVEFMTGYPVHPTDKSLTAALSDDNEFDPDEAVSGTTRSVGSDESESEEEDGDREEWARLTAVPRNTGASTGALPFVCRILERRSYRAGTPKPTGVDLVMESVSFVKRVCAALHEASPAHFLPLVGTLPCPRASGYDAHVFPRATCSLADLTDAGLRGSPVPAAVTPAGKVAMALQLLVALRDAHAAIQFRHNDWRPANVLLSPQPVTFVPSRTEDPRLVRAAYAVPFVVQVIDFDWSSFTDDRARRCVSAVVYGASAHKDYELSERAGNHQPIFLPHLDVQHALVLLMRATGIWHVTELEDPDCPDPLKWEPVKGRDCVVLRWLRDLIVWTEPTFSEGGAPIDVAGTRRPSAADTIARALDTLPECIDP